MNFSSKKNKTKENNGCTVELTKTRQNKNTSHTSARSWDVSYCFDLQIQNTWEAKKLQIRETLELAGSLPWWAKNRNSQNKTWCFLQKHQFYLGDFFFFFFENLH